MSSRGCDLRNRDLSTLRGRGQRYGALICDLERRQIIDLLPDREPATVEAWLKGQPQIEVVARDRNGGYGGAVSRALQRNGRTRGDPIQPVRHRV